MEIAFHGKKPVEIHISFLLGGVPRYVGGGQAGWTGVVEEKRGREAGMGMVIGGHPPWLSRTVKFASGPRGP